MGSRINAFGRVVTRALSLQGLAGRVSYSEPLCVRPLVCEAGRCFTLRMAQPHVPIEGRYSSEDGKQQFLRELFDAGAPHYDRIGTIGSLGTGHRYRRQALQRAGLRPGQAVLDVACGTGAVTRAIVELLNGQGRVVGVDPSRGMLARAKARVRAEFREGLAEALPFPDASFDFLTMGYALRHVTDLDKAFREYQRVLRPGGQVLLLEITRPRGRVQRAAARFYFREFLVWMVRLTGGNQAARDMMIYYWETIDACVPPETILSALRAVGYEDVTRRVKMGIFSEYQARKP